MKQLLTVGDSFTYGDELTDIYQAWPYILADMCNYEVHNLGLNGASNESILRRTMEELAVSRYDLVIVAWTNPGRIEWKDVVGQPYNVWPGMVVGEHYESWRRLLIEYVSKHHSPEYLYQRYLIDVILLQSYCKTNNINLLMIDVFYNNYYRAAGFQQHDKLEQQIDQSQFVGWGKFGMRELVADLPRGPRNHPLEKGHRKIADELAKHIRN